MALRDARDRLRLWLAKPATNQQLSIVFFLTVAMIVLPWWFVEQVALIVGYGIVLLSFFILMLAVTFGS